MTKTARSTLCVALYGRLLDRTPSERSEDKLVFLINVHRKHCSFANEPPAAAERMGIDDESDQVP